MQHQKKDNSDFIRQLARSYGFADCGISEAAFLEPEANRLETWLKKGYHAEMGYMENHFEKRLDPRLLVPGAKTVVSLLYNYFPEEKQNADTYKIARYAYGEDYHEVIKDKLKAMLDDIKAVKGDIAARVFVDSGPVMERAWAERSGLGWIGRHGLLISKSKGSWFFLAELILDLDCEPDGPVTDHCGTCTRCVDACPTEAILPDKTLNAGQCISYLTIELRNQLPSDFKGKMNDWIFGCDICQEVCPWNRFAMPNKEERFRPVPSLLSYGRDEWEALGKEVFKDMFKKSPLKRTGFEGLKRNIRFVSGKSEENPEAC